MVSQSEERAASLVELWIADPLQAWMDWLPEDEHPREWQPEALDYFRDPENRRAAFVATREAGKSRFMAMLGLHRLATRPRSTVLAFAPIDRQIKSAYWTEVAILLRQSLVLQRLHPDWRLQEREIVTGVPDHRMAAVATNDPAALEGWHSRDTTVLIDESQAFSDAHFNSIQGINPNLLIACGTGGDDAGWFAEAFGRMSWFWNVTRRITASEIPRLKESFEREQKRLGIDNPILRRMWLAEFCSASEYSIFDEALLLRARGLEPRQVYDETHPPFGDVPQGPVVLGVDPARGGPSGDDCAVAVLRGHKIERIFTLPPGDEMALAAAIAVEAHRYNASSVVVEAAGLGHGVYARTAELLQRTRTLVSSFVGAKKAVYDETAANQKAEVVLRMRTMLLESGLGLPAGQEFDRLAGELMRLRLVSTMDEKVRITDPPKSPDFADAVIAALSELVYSRVGITTVDCDWF